MKYPVGTSFTLVNGDNTHVITGYNTDGTDIGRVYIATLIPDGRCVGHNYLVNLLDIMLGDSDRYTVTLPPKKYKLPEGLFTL
jgi:hypothetical protein